MNFRPFLLAAILFSTSLPALSQTTADDHKHWAEVTHKYEIAPLDEEADHDAKFAVAEIATAHDFHVAICQGFYDEFNESKYEFHSQTRLLYMLGAATYQVESGKTDGEGTNLYALHSVLKGYAAILREKPTAKDKMLDELARLDAKNKLSESIAKKNCR